MSEVFIIIAKVLIRTIYRFYPAHIIWSISRQFHIPYMEDWNVLVIFGALSAVRISQYGLRSEGSKRKSINVVEESADFIVSLLATTLALTTTWGVLTIIAKLIFVE